MPFLFAPPPQAVIPVQDERYEFFPVNRVYGAAKNYAADEKQRAAAAGFVPPLFMKSSDSIHPVADGEVYRWPMPARTARMVPELELVACLHKGGRNLSVEEAQECIWGWCVGFDFTRRLAPEDLPAGGPWDLMKTLDGGAAPSLSHADAGAGRDLPLSEQSEKAVGQHGFHDCPARGAHCAHFPLLGSSSGRRYLHRRSGQCA